MTIPLGVSRNTIYGHLLGGEIFNMSLWAGEAPTGQAATQAQANAFRDAIVTAMGLTAAPKSFLQTTSGYDGLKVYSYQSSGGHATNIADASMSQPGTAATSFQLPNQAAVCVSLKTDSAGRTKQGRIYMPLGVYGLSSGQLTSGDCTAIATWWRNLIVSLNTAIGGPAKIGVLSQKLGTIQPVTAVAVDSKVDIQRRRANKQVAVARAVVAV